MSTLETTMSMMKQCTEDELYVVQQVIRQFVMSREQNMISKRKFLEELKEARDQHETGRCQEAGAVLEELRNNYGL